MIIKLRSIFYILFYFQAIAFADASQIKKAKNDYFLKLGEEIIFLKDKNGTIFELKPLRTPNSQIKGLSGVKRKPRRLTPEPRGKGLVRLITKKGFETRPN